MKVIVAIDSLKGSLSSLEAGEAARAGIVRVDPRAQVEVRPLADGGEGTVQALTLGMGGVLHTVTVTGPIGQAVNAQYGILKDGKTAVLDMSQASGITLVDEAHKDPMHTTTFGVGQMILDALDQGCRHFIVGLGGSATNDGGIGMLQALGFDLLDKDGKQVPLGALGLRELNSITVKNADPRLTECQFRVACDVTNPLTGPQGCSAVFGPQKGADNEEISQMDAWLSHYAALTRETFAKADPNIEGAGAAGGLGFAFLVFLNASLEPGVQIVLEETKLADYVRDADLVITGEGRLDGQTVMGKAPIGVAKTAKKYGKPVIAFGGAVTKDARLCNEHGIDAFFPIVRGVTTLSEAMRPEQARENMSDAVEQAMRLFLVRR